MESMITLPKVMEWLREVKDPEIPVVSLVDLGVITDVAISDNGVKINMTPTFVGCPAMDYMVNDVKSTLNSKGVENVEVIVSFDKQWSSNNISEKGRSALKEFGLAPPPHYDRIVDIEILEQTPAPIAIAQTPS